MHIKGAPATDAERATIAQMHADGASRNQIVTATGLGAGTVSKIARDLGLSFDVARVAPATAIRTAGFKVRRQAIQGRLLARAEKLLDRLEADQYQAVLRHATGDTVETLTFVPARDEKDLQYALYGYLASEERLERVGGDAGIAAASSVVSSLMDGLRSLQAQGSDNGGSVDSGM